MRTSRWMPCSPEGAVGVRGLHLEGGGLDARFLGLLRLEDLDAVTVPLTPPQVHPQQHLREVLAVDPALARGDLHERVAGVVLPRQQGPDLERLDVAPQRGQFGVGFLAGTLVVLVGRELEHQGDVVEPAAEIPEAVEIRLGAGQRTRHLLGALLVAPEVRVRGLLLEVGELQPQLRQVQHLLDAGQGGVERLDVVRRIRRHTLEGSRCTADRPTARTRTADERSAARAGRLRRLGALVRREQDRVERVLRQRLVRVAGGGHDLGQ
jgi:hypothetical protein